MRFEEFIGRVPRLYRIALQGSSEGIRKHGLLTAASLASKAGVSLPDAPRKTLLDARLPDGTSASITDTLPLDFGKLASVLDDGLTPEDWLHFLNNRVFFWPEKKLGEGNGRARSRLGYLSEWQVYDTKTLLEPVWHRAEIAPINTGSTIHTPARRGLSTFAPIATVDWEAWRWQRGNKTPDKIKEVTVRDGVPNAGSALLEVYPDPPR